MYLQSDVQIRTLDQEKHFYAIRKQILDNQHWPGIGFLCFVSGDYNLNGGPFKCLILRPALTFSLERMTFM